MTPLAAELDQVFKAVADPTRRRVVERLAAGPAATTALAEPFDMALPSFLQHLRVLEQAGVVHSTKSGRVRTYTLVPSTLATAGGWLEEQRRMWDRRLDQLDELLTELENDR